MNTEPRSIPDGNPVPFAICPTGSLLYWPVWPRVEGAKADRTVTYKDVTGAIIGVSPSRRFLADRGDTTQSEGTLRYHVGVDVYAKTGDKVVAIAPGRIVAFYPFYTAASGKMTYALLMQHDGVVCNYGEVTEDTTKKLELSVGDEVFGAQWIGVVSDTNMVHFETYTSGTVQSYRWMQRALRPTVLLNPTKLLLTLAESGI